MDDWLKCVDNILIFTFILVRVKREEWFNRTTVFSQIRKYPQMMMTTREEPDQTKQYRTHLILNLDDNSK